MAQVGSWGDIISFEVSEDKVLTFNNYERSVSGRWEKHDLFQRMPRSEFLGRGVEAVQMDVTISAYSKVKVSQTIKKLEDAIRQGAVANLYVGGKRVGNKQMLLESATEKAEYYAPTGQPSVVVVSLQFSSYN